jgi:hypothetical protein
MTVAIGISIAASIALQAAAYYLKPTQNISSGGLEDLTSPKSNYGIVIPQCWGKVGLTGNLVWSTDKIEVTKKKRRGKGGGVVEETKSYYGNLAVLFAYCPTTPAQEFERVWFNGKLVYSIHGDAETLANSDDFASKYMRFYHGDSMQLPDPLIESSTPTAIYDYGIPWSEPERSLAITALGLNPSDPFVHGYRKRAYGVCEGLPLGEWGNNFPVFKSEIRFHDNCTLENIISDICTQSGLEPDQFACYGCDQIVRGFYIDRVMAAREALTLLQQAYFFDIVDGGNKLKFIAKSFDRPIIHIPFQDLAARESGQERPVTFTKDPEFTSNLPQEVEVNFINPNLKYQTDNVKTRSQVAKTKKKEVYQLPMILNEDEALAIAEKLLHQWFLESEKITFSLPPSYLYLEVGDRVNLPNVGTLQLTKIRIGANKLMQCEGKIYAQSTASNLTRNVTVEHGGYNPPTNTIVSQGNTNLYVLDIPLIKDSDDDYGLYLTANGGANWRECSVYASNDNSRYELITTLEAGTLGTLLTSMSNSTTSFQVVLTSGEIEGVSVADLDAGFNKLLVGNEILQFETATLTAANTYTLSGLRRGKRGTENYQNHPVGERVILLSDLYRLSGSVADLHQTRYFKAVSPGQALDSVSPINITVAGISLRPYSPINLSATKDEYNNITITWDRRDRHAGDRTDIQNFPLSESREEYKLSVGNQNITTNKKSAIYTRAQQMADYGSPQSTITVTLKQVSSEYGDGEGITTTLLPTLAPAIPVINSFSPVSASVGDTVTLIGTGLSGLTGVSITGVSQTSLAVSGDSSASFVIAANTTTGLISATTPGGVGNSAIALLVGVGSGVGEAIFINVTASRSLLDSDKGAILLCDTSAGDVTLTLDETSLNPPEGFYATVIRSGLNKVSFAAVNFIAEGVEINGDKRAAQILYQGSGIWRGLGALNIELASNLTDYALKTEALLKSNFLSNNYIDPTKTLIHSGSIISVPYTLLVSDLGKELVIAANTTGILRIPDSNTGFPGGWWCLVSLDGDGDITIERASGGTSQLYLSGGVNHLKKTGTIQIWHRSNNFWKIVGGLEA